LSIYSESSADAKGLAAALSVGPILLVGLVLAWRWISAVAALALGAALCACLYRYWSVIEAHYAWGDLAQQCGAYGFVALGFGRSLFGGRVPLCTQLAITMHGELTPVEVKYTRRATVVWLLFYVALAVAILALFFLSSRSAWSLFVNFGTFALILLGGIADHLLRRRLLPRHPGGGLLTIVRRALIG
jgi:uncharacterized membrane protein